MHVLTTTAPGIAIGSPKTDRRFLLICAALFAAALTLRIAIIFATGMNHDLYFYELERTAFCLATRGVYGNPFMIDTGPTAHVVPAYTLLLAAIFKLFGYTVTAETVKEILAATVASVRCGLLPWLAVRMGLNRPAALIAGILSVAWIGPLETELKGGWESPYTALFLLILTARHFIHPVSKQTTGQAMITGVLWGVLFLLNPATVLVLLAFLIVDLFRTRRWFWRNAIIVAGTIFVVLLPWGLRNQGALGSFILTRSNFGLELYLAYHPGAAWNNLANVRGEDGVHPINNPQEALRVRELGEVAYNREKLDLALDWIRTEPAEAAHLAFLHFVRFWFPPGRTVAYTALLWVLTLIALVGYVLLWRQARDLAIHFGALLMSFPLMYYVVSWSSRYRDPIEWVMLLLVAIVISEIIRQARPFQEVCTLRTTQPSIPAHPVS